MKSKKNCHSEREMCHSELVSESHWQMKTLGEVCEFSRGLTYSKKDEVPFSNTVVLRSNNVNLLTYELDFTELKYISDDIVVSDEKRLQKNSLLICIANGSKNHLGKVALIEDEKNFAFGGFMGKITPNSIIVPKFLYYSMLTDSYKKFIAKLSDGTNINNLKFIDLKDYQIPLPPLEEQKRIVEILDKKFLQIQNLLNAAQKSLQDVKELKQSVISEQLKVDSEKLKVDGDKLQVKSGWQIKTLGEVCEFSRGLTYSKKDEVPFSNTVVLRSNNVNLLTYELDFTELKYISDDIVVSDEKRLQKNSLLICIANGSKNHLGKVALIEDEKNFAFGGFMGKITPNSIIVPKFLYYSMLTDSYKKFIAKLSDGTNINNLKFNDLKDYQIPLPPLEEQKRIVEILDKKFLQIQNLLNVAQKSLQDVKELKQSVISEKLKVDSEKLKVDSEKLKVKNGWQIKTLGEVSTTKLSYGASVSACEYDGEVRYIRITDINDDGNLNNDLVSPETYEEKHVLQDGDIVFARTGATVGKSFLYETKFNKCVYAGYLIRLRPNKKIVSPRFIFYCTKTKEYEEFIKISQASAAQPNVNAEKYSNYSIPLPPLAEQELIVKTLDLQTSKLKELEQNYTEQIALYQELKQSLLQQAFSGELSS